MTTPNARDGAGEAGRFAGTHAAMEKYNLTAIVAPTDSPAWLTDYVNGDHYVGGCSTPAAVAGYPHITVPAGFVAGLPIGWSFFGRALSEETLLGLGLALSFELATRARRAPRLAAHASSSLTASNIRISNSSLRL